jgi:hypothetical protein
MIDSPDCFCELVINAIYQNEVGSANIIWQLLKKNPAIKLSCWVGILRVLDMKKIYTSPDRMMVFHFKNILESYHIDCIVKNEYLAGAAGELPPNECWPELWIDDDKYDQAVSILEQTETFQTLPTWTCTHCGEVLEGQFTACWQCGESRYR